MATVAHLRVVCAVCDCFSGCVCVRICVPESRDLLARHLEPVSLTAEAGADQSLSFQEKIL